MMFPTIGWHLNNSTFESKASILQHADNIKIKQ